MNAISRFAYQLFVGVLVFYVASAINVLPKPLDGVAAGLAALGAILILVAGCCTLINCHTRTTSPENERNKIRVYVIARISQDAHAWTDFVCASLERTGMDVFKHKDHNPWNKLGHEQFSREVFETDLNAMKRSHIGLVIPEYGCDCAWEAGWYANSDKPVVAFVDSQTAWLRDWMVKGGISCVVTTNLATYQVLRDDPILSFARVLLISALDDLGLELAKILRKEEKP